MNEIKDIETLLKPCLQPSSEIVSQNFSRLTLPGENYGSLMLSLDVKVKTEDSEEDTNFVAKLIPENEWLQEMFQVQYTFVKEIEFYRTFIPTLQGLQKEAGVENVVNFFPKFFGGRINLNSGSDKVDENGVILLENLKPQGYVVKDRLVGFDLEFTRFILTDLATFHALSTALKLKKPAVFQKCIVPYVVPVKLFCDDIKHCADSLLNRYNFAVGDDEECLALYPRVQASILTLLSSPRAIEETPFTTLIHNDLWMNNIMLKLSNEKPVSNKFIDFQLVDYGSPARDVMFFLYTSVQTSVLKDNFEDLLKFYFTKFLEGLRSLDCDVAPFTFAAFENELKSSACVEFFHLMFMLKPICCSPHKLKDIKDFSEEDLKDDYIPRRQIEKSCLIIKDFAKRGWI